MKSTQILKDEHITIRRIKNIALQCSKRLYASEYVPIEDIDIISVIIEEFIDQFHHGKEEKAYFPETKDKDGLSEEIRKFLIEHEFGRRIAMMLRRELKEWKTKIKENGLNNGADRLSSEPVARFLKTYAIFIEDHTGKEDKFFDRVEEREIISDKEDHLLLIHYESCKNRVGGEVRMKEMVKLIEYLEQREWMSI